MTLARSKEKVSHSFKQAQPVEPYPKRPKIKAPKSPQLLPDSSAVSFLGAYPGRREEYPQPYTSP